MTEKHRPNQPTGPADPVGSTGPADPAGPADPLPVGTVMCGVEGESAHQVLEAVAARLIDDGIVDPAFPAALWEREQRYPTGLPTRIPTAIPHTDAEHVRTACLAVATLAHPVAFGEMGGGEDDTVDAHLIVMPLVTEPSEVVPALQRMMSVLTDEKVVTEMLAAGDESELRELAERCLCGPDA